MFILIHTLWLGIYMYLKWRTIAALERWHGSHSSHLSVPSYLIILNFAMQWFMDMNSIGVTFIAQSVQQIKDCIQVFEEDLNPSGLPIAGYFFLKDIWGCWEECSAYGQGTLVKLANGQEVNQYFTPHLSAIHLMRNRRIDQKKVVTNGSTKATESWSTRETKSGDLTKGKLRDLPTGESSSNDQEECKKACFSDSSFKFYDTKRHFEKAPLFSKMQEQDHACCNIASETFDTRAGLSNNVKRNCKGLQ